MVALDAGRYLDRRPGRALARENPAWLGAPAGVAHRLSSPLPRRGHGPRRGMGDRTLGLLTCHPTSGDRCIFGGGCARSDRCTIAAGGSPGKLRYNGPLGLSLLLGGFPLLGRKPNTGGCALPSPRRP